MSEKSSYTEKAYRSREFLGSSEARPLRILAEYLEPKARFERYHIDDTIVFFGSARIKPRDEAEKTLEAARAAPGAAAGAAAGAHGGGDGGELARAEMHYELSAYYEATRELARRLTEWSKSLDQGERRFVVCSGGGPGIMEAANRGASEAKGVNAGLGIALPFEETGSPYITRELAFAFHYFFMRKFWFAYLAKAFVVMPGGFGTLDELFEMLTLVQTQKVKKRMPIVLFGSKYWAEVINLEALERYGTISPGDAELFFRTDSVDEAFDYITEQLTEYALAVPGATL
ncbi:MAG: LOG family protein [Rhodospirillales bacterium]|nr:LOG family protein [Rhodospirillales bacterium]